MSEVATDTQALYVTYTIFKDVTPTSGEQHSDVSWTSLVNRIIDAPTFLRKDTCPLISMAEYGTRPSARGCIRHAGNVLRVYGIECDYDDEKMSLETATARLNAASIRGVFYTSARHSQDRPRWRCILPLAEPCNPDKREYYVGRANQIFGGVLSGESFTLSQSFYIGRVGGVTYETATVEGRCIDMAADIEPLYHKDENTENGYDKRTDAQLRESFIKGVGRYQAMLKLSSRWAARGRKTDDIEADLHALLGQLDTKNADGVDLASRIEGLAVSAVAKYGETRARVVTTADNPLAKESAPVSQILGTDIANSARLYEKHGNNIHYTVERGWLIWSGMHWQIDDKAVAVAKFAVDAANEMFDEIRESDKKDDQFKAAKLFANRRGMEGAIWVLRTEPGVYQELTTFDVNPWILNCRNGVVDLKTGRLLPHAREQRCTLLAGCDYDPYAQATRWRQFIAEVCCDNYELMDYMQRVCGYMLTASTDEQCLFFLHGMGRNGKTIFVETLMAVLDKYAAAAEPEMIMTKKHAGIPNDVAALRGVRAVFMNETNQNQRFDEAKLKNLTGGDSLRARFMREEFFTFKPTHKLMLRGNHKPTVNGTDEGIWRRLKLVPFDLRLKDEDVDQHLQDTLKGEHAGVLAWMVEGCLAWQREGLKTPQIITDAVAAYRAESDTLARFVDEHCETSKLATVKASALYRRYKEFCEQSSERWMSAKDFPQEIEKKGFLRVRRSSGMIFEGIELRQQEQRFTPYSSSDD